MTTYKFSEDFMTVKHDDEKLNQFIDYLVENYIDPRSDCALNI